MRFELLDTRPGGQWNNTWCDHYQSCHRTCCPILPVWAASGVPRGFCRSYYSHNEKRQACVRPVSKKLAYLTAWHQPGS